MGVYQLHERTIGRHDAHTAVGDGGRRQPEAYRRRFGNHAALTAFAATLVGLPLAGQAQLAAAQSAARPSPFAVRKAESLLRDRLPCLGCHAFGDEGGRLAPDLRSVRERRSADYIARMVDAPQETVPGSVMPRIAMLPATRDAIVHYLQSLPGDGQVPASSGGPASALAASTDGAALYGAWCAGCHGTRGKGDGANAAHLPVRPAAHADASAMRQRSDDALYDTIAGGGAIMNRSARMPAFGETLSDSQIRALVGYIRTLCDCSGPAWSTR